MVSAKEPWNRLSTNEQYLCATSRGRSNDRSQRGLCNNMENFEVTKTWKVVPRWNKLPTSNAWNGPEQISKPGEITSRGLPPDRAASNSVGDYWILTNSLTVPLWLSVLEEDANNLKSE